MILWEKQSVAAGITFIVSSAVEIIMNNHNEMQPKSTIELSNATFQSNCGIRGVGIYLLPSHLLLWIWFHCEEEEIQGIMAINRWWIDETFTNCMSIIRKTIKKVLTDIWRERELDAIEELSSLSFWHLT